MQDAESKDIVSCFTFVFKRKSEKLGSTKSSHYVHMDLSLGREVMSTFLFLNGRNDETTIVVYRWIFNNHGKIHELVIRHSSVLLIKSANIIVEKGLGQ